MGKPAKKSTKKFEKKHLDAGLKHRKKLKPMVNALKRKAAAWKPHVKDEVAAAVEKQQPGRSDGKKLPTSEVSQHKEQLDTLKEKDPEFYEFLKEHDKDLLDFNDEDEEEEEEDEDPLASDEDKSEGLPKTDGSPQILSRALVDEWCVGLRQKQNIGALKNFLQAYRTACHYGDGKEEDDSRSFKYICRSSHVFNKIMMFGLCEVDGIFRKLLGLSSKGEADEAKGFSTADLQKNKKWKKMEPFVKAYLGNSLNILNQMTDNEMIAFTLRRLKVSIPFLGPFPKLARRFLKVALHFLCSGDGIVPVISIFYIREMALQLGDDVVDAVLKGVYREFAATSRFVNSTTLPQIQFRANCVVELYGIDTTASYQLAYVFIQQMAIVLRNAITMKTKTAFKSVYCWQYINCLRLWVKTICTYPGKDDGLRHLLYPLVQIIEGVAQLVPTVRYFPLRLQCVKMLNELAASTEVFIPVTPLLLDMLKCKELYMSPTGGVGKAVDFDMTLKIPKPAIRTRELQEGYVGAVLDQLTRHLAQWSYSIAFPELASIPLLHLKQVLKSMNVDRFCRKVKQLVAQIELNMQFVWRKRDKATFALDDTKAVSAFLQVEKETGSSPLSQYVVKLQEQSDHQRHMRVREDKETKDDSASAKEDTRDSDLDGEDDADVVEDLFVSFDGKKSS